MRDTSCGYVRAKRRKECWHRLLFRHLLSADRTVLGFRWYYTVIDHDGEDLRIKEETFLYDASFCYEDANEDYESYLLMRARALLQNYRLFVLHKTEWR